MNGSPGNVAITMSSLDHDGGDVHVEDRLLVPKRPVNRRESLLYRIVVSVRAAGCMDLASLTVSYASNSPTRSMVP